MEQLKAVFVSVCTSLIFIGFFAKLLPRRTLSRNMKSLLSFVVLLLILSPLIGSGGFRGFDVRGDAETTASESKKDYRVAVAEETVGVLKARIERFLLKKEVGFYAVTIDYSTSDDGVEIGEIPVFLKSGLRPPEMQRMLKNEFRIDAKVKVGEST